MKVVSKIKTGIVSEPLFVNQDLLIFQRIHGILNRKIKQKPKLSFKGDEIYEKYSSL